MLHEVDQALRTFLAPQLPDGTELSFECPTAAPPHMKGKAAEMTPAVVHLFLNRVCEDTNGRNAGWTDVRSGTRTVVGRTPPVRRFQLSYLVSVAAVAASREHELLGAALTAFAGTDVLPADCLSGALAGCRTPVELHLAQATVQGGGAWSALSLPARSYFGLTVTAPLILAPTQVAAPAGVLNIDFDTTSAPAAAPATEPVMRAEAPPGGRQFTTVRVRENRAPMPPRLLRPRFDSRGDVGPDPQ